jgi:DNA-nicking Smr family endonuclease
MAAPPRKHGREATPEERRLWERAMGEAKPLPPSAPPRSEAGEPAAETVKQPPRPRAPAAAPPPPARTENEPAPSQSLSGLDKRSAQRLRRGQLAIEAELDLHRHTLAQAHQALVRFIAAAQAGGKRCVLVITGKGGVGEAPWGEPPWGEAPTGVLRREVPRWLSEPGTRDRVVAWHPARRQHGGEGALYVLLRRRRD